MNDQPPDESRLIAALPGDGIGAEVTEQALRVLAAVAEGWGHDFEVRRAPVGGEAIDRFDDPLPVETLELCDEAEAIFLGAVGGPKWSDPSARVRPEQGILRLRKELGFFVNLRPVKSYPLLAAASPLKPERLEGVDLVIVRELTGGLYFGPRKTEADTALDTMVYTEAEIERTVRVAFELATRRRKLVTSVDKANVLDTSRLWRRTAERVAADFPDVRLEHRLVDATAMQIIARPSDFDVLVTENLFGDILSDEASVLAASLGMLPSASLAGSPAAAHAPARDGAIRRPGRGTKGLYEPVHGSAPDIAGQGIANPYGAILSVAMMLRHTFGLEDEAAAVESAVEEAIAAGAVTPDIVAPGLEPVGTEAVASTVVEIVAGSGH